MSSTYERRRLVAPLIAIAALIYWFAVRPWHLRWGATDEESNGSLPGDGLLRDPESEVTHAVTIDAPVEEVWPWLVQIGQGRGGFYSYDWLENLVGADIHNADRILPAHQDLEVGDTVHLAPEDYSVQTPESAPEVAVLDPERAIVLQPPGESPRWTWAFVLRPLDDETTRFVARMRSHGKQDIAGRAADVLFWEPAHFVMERKMLLGVKERAESSKYGTRKNVNRA
ncbi:hypothetical protein ZOD2009_10355 [Haladaptatus paucihalophilus DX253]|uniref:SRPBCC family protein n=1 Tax=Haladaptatus paucihalophilus DX253 TaxID=797209 RepID=E7QTE3_HALPU|nr:hypothetical protein [Haladaptatus paucihalophilus]EFW91872.1 hypothetical protein ZOD2009_10355 [Haladaptatus paucihalophilus DX253]SHK81710.1 hypothetical protein SAMN05444342_2274 [Haladaptatus paucihalophilus DX253]